MKKFFRVFFLAILVVFLSDHQNRTSAQTTLADSNPLQVVIDERGIAVGVFGLSRIQAFQLRIEMPGGAVETHRIASDTFAWDLPADAADGLYRYEVVVLEGAASTTFTDGGQKSLPEYRQSGLFEVERVSIKSSTTSMEQRSSLFQDLIEGFASLLEETLIGQAAAANLTASDLFPTVFFNDTFLVDQVDEWAVGALRSTAVCTETVSGGASYFFVDDLVQNNSVFTICNSANNSGTMTVDSEGDITFAANKFFMDRLTGWLGLSTTVPLAPIHISQQAQSTILMEATGRGDTLEFGLYDPFVVDNPEFRFTFDKSGAPFPTVPVMFNLNAPNGAMQLDATGKLTVFDFGCLVGDCVTAADIADGTITPDDIQPGSINATVIASNTIGPNKLIPGSINAATIANNSIGPNKLIPGSINTATIANNAVTGNKIATGVVSSAKILNATILMEDLSQEVVDAINASPSSRFYKTDFEPVDSADILQRITAMDIKRWRYLEGQGDGGRHIGPMAEDFNAAFGQGGNPQMISRVDADGVLFAAVQALAAKAGRIAELESQIREQNARLDRLEAALIDTD
ncbi:tail fiber domain-containing protein [Limibacillus sp. MBR-115]|uniref:tail fiber domain-containing protein n=1 Tax=Limibacillus sp. MBR-115 TaxID=3156465 RepID=UPI0033926721